MTSPSPELIEAVGHEIWLTTSSGYTLAAEAAKRVIPLIETALLREMLERVLLPYRFKGLAGLPQQEDTDECVKLLNDTATERGYQLGEGE